MTRIYLWTNAALYGVLSLGSTLAFGEASLATGFQTIDDSGRSQLLTLYGGFFLGLGAFYAYLAASPHQYRLGLNFSIFLYSGVVLYRLASLMMFPDAGAAVYALATAEVVLLVAAVNLSLAQVDSAGADFGRV